MTSIISINLSKPSTTKAHFAFTSIVEVEEKIKLSDGLEIKSAEISFPLFSLKQGTKIDPTWNVHDIFVTQY